MSTIINKSGLSAVINHKGAELVSLKKGNKEFIWDGNPDFWGKHSPVLFPIVGTLKSNTYQYNNKSYNLSRHGFAREMDFTLVDKSESSATFSLRASEQTKKVYPFDFELQIVYTFDENFLTILYKVINNGDNPMPFSIGAHPAFALTGDFEHYSLEFGQDEPLTYYLLENDLVSETTATLQLVNKKLPLSYSIFENDALIFKYLASKTITILENQKPLLKVRFEDFPNLGIWTKVKAPFICVEPWYGYSDTTNSNGNLFEKEGMQKLQHNSKFSAKFSIEVF